MGSDAPRHIGVFGGAFDPPHRAHVALVQAAVTQLALDRLHVLPTGQAWHKARVLSPAADRLAMAELAFGSLPGVVVDDRELRRAGPTYTVDTLRELQAEQPQAELFLVIGGDQAGALESWREWREIIRLATVSVAVRPASADSPGPLDASGPGGLAAGVAALARVRVLVMPPTDLSATAIRQRVARSQGIAHLVPEPVARYIDQHHLYLAT
jgi:nicotinate-nucleotide adenylyltransferase